MNKFRLKQVLYWFVFPYMKPKVTGQVLTGNWTWLSGSNSINQVAVYGTQGLPSVNNRPGARHGLSLFMDVSGQLIYVFGGWGYGPTTKVRLNDIWMFNVTSGWWTWLDGSNTGNQVGLYGTQRMATASNQPGARSEHSMSINPTGQLFFIFGGWGLGTTTPEGRLNDLWMYNLTSGLWTWLSGSSTGNQEGIYGTQGVASVNNRPGARASHAMSMHPSGGQLLVFGGFGYDKFSNEEGPLNDLWSYNLTSERWTWLSGASTHSQVGVYGTQGITSSNTQPGSRHDHSMVVNPSGQLLVFGGRGLDQFSIEGNLSDMWMHNFTSGWWTWLNGPNRINQVGIYGTLGEAYANNQPGARHCHSLRIHSSGQLIFLFGGIGLGTTTSEGHLNDMWIYNLLSGRWNWLGGTNTTNQVGRYGTQGKASPSNGPGAREAHSVIIHPSGQWLFLFGGWGYDTGITKGHMNDLWKFSLSFFATNNGDTNTSSMINSYFLATSQPITSTKSNVVTSIMTTSSPIRTSLASTGTFVTPLSVSQAPNSWSCPNHEECYSSDVSLSSTASSTPEGKPRIINFWTDYQLVGWIIIVCAWVLLLEIGFCGGFLYEKTVRQLQNDDDVASSRMLSFASTSSSTKSQLTSMESDCKTLAVPSTNSSSHPGQTKSSMHSYSTTREPPTLMSSSSYSGGGKPDFISQSYRPSIGRKTP